MSQEDAPIRRLKWGTASLIARAPVTPIVLPIFHHGFEEVVPPPPPLFSCVTALQFMYIFQVPLLDLVQLVRLGGW